MRVFLIFLSSTALLLTAGCGMMHGKSQPQSPTVYVPDAPAPEPTAAPMTVQKPSVPEVQPVVDAPVNAPTITVTKTVWDNFLGYLNKVGRVGDGFYAVTQDGTGGGSWACGEALCQGNFDGQAAALKSCTDANPGKTCMIFARDNKIQMKYQVAE